VRERERERERERAVGCVSFFAVYFCVQCCSFIRGVGRLCVSVCVREVGRVSLVVADSCGQFCLFRCVA